MTTATAQSETITATRPCPIGICLDGLEVQAAVYIETDDEIEVRPAELAETAIPPAVLVPRFAGEPVRTELAWPPHPRGSGERWPPEARVEGEQEPGRFPLAYAWSMLLADRVEPAVHWQWSFPDVRGRVGPAEAIACAAASVLQRIGGGNSDRTDSSCHGRPGRADSQVASDAEHGRDGCGTNPTEHGRGTSSAAATVLVVPDGLHEHARHQVLTQLRKHDIEARLLWRSLAATTAWCDEWSDQLDPPDNLRGVAERSPGSVLSLHMGLEHWEASVVDLHWKTGRDGVSLMPVRRRPVAGPLQSYGLELMHRLAGRSLEMSYQQISPGRVWELLWCTPWMGRVLSLLADPRSCVPRKASEANQCEGITPLHNLSSHVRAAEFLRQQWRQATQQIFGPTRTVPGLINKHLPPTPTIDQIRNWCQQHRRSVEDRRLVGAVITGPMAGVLAEGEPLGLRYLREIWPKPINVLVEGEAQTPLGVLAHSAAEYGAHIAARRDTASADAEPMFLDSLPRVSIAAATTQGPGWVELIDTEDRPVDADVTWHRFERIGGLTIRPGRSTLTLALRHDDHATIHTVSVRLPMRMTRQRQFALQVSAEPGQGHPSIDIKPLDDEPLRTRVCVDWRTLRDTGLTPEQYLKKITG